MKAITASTIQVYAFLFQTDGRIQLAAEGSSSGETLDVPNWDEGVTEANEWIVSLQIDGKERFLCCAAAPDSELTGLFFEETNATDEVCRFLLHKPGYLGFARRRVLDSTNANNVIPAYREQFPSSQHTAKRNSPELEWAARNGNLEQVRLLLSEGSNPNSSDPYYLIKLLSDAKYHLGDRNTALNFAAAY